MALLMFLTVPFLRDAGQCSEIRLDKRLVVFPKYTAPQEQVKLYRHILVEIWGSLTLVQCLSPRKKAQSSCCKG